MANRGVVLDLDDVLDIEADLSYYEKVTEVGILIFIFRDILPKFQDYRIINIYSVPSCF